MGVHTGPTAREAAEPPEEDAMQTESLLPTLVIKACREQTWAIMPTVARPLPFAAARSDCGGLGIPAPGFPKQQRRSRKQQDEQRVCTKPAQYSRCPRRKLRVPNHERNRQH